MGACGEEEGEGDQEIRICVLLYPLVNKRCRFIGFEISNLCKNRARLPASRGRGLDRTYPRGGPVRPSRR
jgi:hypothetical protein